MNDYCYLDSIRINEGIHKCIEVFKETCEKNRYSAVNMLNDSRISFTCVFILLPQIEDFRLFSSLNPRYITAIRIINQILNPDSNDALNLTIKNNSVCTALKWISETGGAEEIQSDEYEEIMDKVIAVLICIYKEKSVLPLVRDMIFMRRKKERNIHDLVWAFFRIKDPYSLELIADKILSPDKEEAELACDLLNIEYDSEDNKQGLYDTYINWINENDPFLYFTGESYLFSSKPILCRVDLERKYINKGTPDYYNQPLSESEDNEYKCLAAFKNLNEEDKEILSEYSFKIHNKDESEWKDLMRSPIEEQLKAAKSEEVV